MQNVNSVTFTEVTREKFAVEVYSKDAVISRQDISFHDANGERSRERSENHFCTTILRTRAGRILGKTVSDSHKSGHNGAGTHYFMPKGA